VFKPNDNPSPAHYDVDVPPKWADLTDKPFLQRAPRFDRVRQNNEWTAPGQYEIDTGTELDRAKLAEVPSRVFKTSTDRTPFPVHSISPGPARYSPNLSQDYKLKKCMDGIERSPPGTFVGQKLVDTPGPGNYSPERCDRKLGGSGGYIGVGKRYAFDGRKDTVSPAKYDVSRSFINPSMNPLFTPRTM
jgi:hypothetical protein